MNQCYSSIYIYIWVTELRPILARVDTINNINNIKQSEMGEARMDVIDSEIGYLGYHESESYGLVWKVRFLLVLSCSSIKYTY